MLPPKSSRQTLLFSATFPRNIEELCRFALRPGYSMIDTIGEDAEQTADKVLFRAVLRFRMRGTLARAEVVSVNKCVETFVDYRAELDE